MSLLLIVVALIAVVYSLDNGVAVTPPMVNFLINF